MTMTIKTETHIQTQIYNNDNNGNNDRNTLINHDDNDNNENNDRITYIKETL